MKTENEIRERLILCIEKQAKYKELDSLYPGDGYANSLMAYTKEINVLRWVLEKG